MVGVMPVLSVALNRTSCAIENSPTAWNARTPRFQAHRDRMQAATDALQVGGSRDDISVAPPDLSVSVTTTADDVRWIDSPPFHCPFGPPDRAIWSFAYISRIFRTE